MPKILVNVSYHHTSDNEDHAALLEVPEGADPELFALQYALSYDTDSPLDPEKVAHALQQARAAGEAPLPDNSTELPYVVWYRPGAIPAYPDFGAGPSPTGTLQEASRRSKFWLRVRPYVPDAALRQQMLALPQEQLVEHLLGLFALGQLTWTPPQA